MKKLETVIRPSMTDSVVHAIKKVGVGGLTILRAQGQGSAEDPLVGQYFSKDLIITVVEDSKVNSLLKVIGDVACSGAKGDGKVFVSDIEEVMDICTKECGHTVL